ncbi:MAG: hypothetical protein LRY62_03735 [Alphaproteobacteria bacterium]|nr:hypothetical protein [Alphaproteobacteria bacterium]
MSKQSDIAFRDQLLERLETHAATIESPEQAEQFRLAADKLQESITAYIDYGDTPELYFESSNAELELNVGESFASLFQISGTLSQEMGLEFQGLDRLGGHFEGAVIGVPHSRDEQQKN